MLMLPEVWRNHNFTGKQRGMSGNDFRGLRQASYMVRLTPCRGELPLKACEQFSVSWVVHCYSSCSFRLPEPLSC
jgi:hypothetical protein